MVEGDLFAMTNDSLSALAAWCDRAPTALKDGRRQLNIGFGEGFSFELFSAALKQMSL